MIALVLLSSLVLFTSFVVTRAIKSRSEAMIATSLVFNALVLGPIYVLGFLSRLTRPILAVTIVVLCASIIGGLVRKEGNAGLREVSRRSLAVLGAPFAAIFGAAKQRSLVAVAATLAVLVFPWMLVTAYLAPAWRDWDALWYHEPLVAFTIQNHGFATVDVPTGLQVINGVQRLCEMTQLWFAIWAGRPMVDVANVVFMPLLGASMFALTYRYTRDVTSSVGWASALVLVPGFLRLVQSAMVDPQSAALLLAAAYFVTHHALDRRRAGYAILALTLAVGAKIWSIVPVGLLSLFLFVRLIANRRELGARATWALITGGAFSVIGMQALTYLRNLVLYKNPFWPMVNYENEKLGIHWKGAITVSETAALRFGDPFFVFYEKMIGKPYTATGHHHTWQIDDYGFAWSWIILPLGAACAVLAVLRCVLGEVGARFGIVTTFETRTRARSAAALAVVAGASLYLSPAIHIARYHVASMGMLAACLCWFVGRKGSRVAETAALFGALGSVMMLYWAPRKAPWVCVFEPAQIVRWMKTPLPRREVADIGSPPMLVSPVTEETGMAREREIRAGDVVAFDNIDFVALLWNNAYSNRVVWLSSSDPLGEAESKGAAWVYTRGGTTLSSQLARSGGWQLVGSLEAERFGSVWRRRR